MTAEDVSALLIRVACLWISTLVLVSGVVLRPRVARCPVAWHHNGIRPDGAFSCVRVPVGDPDWDGTYGRPDRSVVPPGEIYGRIYCTGGSHAVVIDDRVVGCQR